MINKLFEMKHSALLFLILIVTFLSYANIMRNQFVWDDFDFIVSWGATDDLSTIPELVKGALPYGHEGVYRPVRSLLYVATKQIFGVHPTGYHMFSIAIHMLVTALVYAIAFSITHSKKSTFIAALLFALHPVHTEAVSYITTSFDLVGVLLALAAFLLYIHNKHSIVSVVLALSAYLTYEMTLVLPLLLLSHDLILQKKRVPHHYFKRIAPYWMGIFLYLMARMLTIGYTSRGVLLAHSGYISVITMLKTIWFYTMALVLPVKLTVTPTLFGSVTNLDIPVDQIRAQSFWDIETLLGVSVLAILLGSIIRYKKRHPIAAFSMLATVICILPVLNPLGTGTLFAEKYLYFSSVFVCIGVGIILSRKNSLLLIGIAAFLMALTVRQNMYWKNPFTLWSRAVYLSPNSAVAHHNLGYAYYQEGNPQKALGEWQHAVTLFPQYAESYINMGEVYMDFQQYDQAIAMYTKAIQANPYLGQGFYELANAYLAVGDLERAQSTIETSLIHNPMDPWLHYNLGVIYLKQEKLKEAYEQLQNAHELDSNQETPAREVLESFTQ